jgi:hypothetical protein
VAVRGGVPTLDVEYSCTLLDTLGGNYDNLLFRDVSHRTVWRAWANQCPAKKRASIVELFGEQDFSRTLVAALNYFCGIHRRQYGKWWLPHIANEILDLQEYVL